MHAAEEDVLWWQLAVTFVGRSVGLSVSNTVNCSKRFMK
jgi:hypothetical protein